MAALAGGWPGALKAVHIHLKPMGSGPYSGLHHERREGRLSIFFRRAMTGPRRSWLLLGGLLSGYTFDLFKTVSELRDIDVRFLYDPIDGLPSYEHEARPGQSANRLWWRNAGVIEIGRFIREPRPEAVFIYGTQPRVKMNLALRFIPRSTPVFYAADSNVISLALHTRRAIAQRLALMPLAKRATAALSLGLTNRLAMHAMGFQHVVDLPVCAVDFAILGASAPKPARDPQVTAFLVIARLDPIKNLPAVLTALLQHPDLLPRVRLVVAGEGPDRGALEALQKQYPQLKLELLGAVSRQALGALFRRSDALLLPSLQDQWGIVVTEALGMGLPVVATPTVGAAVSLAGSTQAVLLSDSIQPQSVVESIRTFIDRREALTLAAQASQKNVRARYDRQAVAQALIALVERRGGQ
jgi:glycosyltransferase involved in cell wall biosynthesis